MREEWVDRKVVIEDVSNFASHLIGQTGRICRKAEYGVEPDKVFVEFSRGGMGYFSIDQLKFIDEE